MFTSWPVTHELCMWASPVTCSGAYTSIAAVRYRVFRSGTERTNWSILRQRRRRVLPSPGRSRSKDGRARRRLHSSKVQTLDGRTWRATGFRRRVSRSFAALRMRNSVASIRDARRATRGPQPSAFSLQPLHHPPQLLCITHRPLRRPGRPATAAADFGKRRLEHCTRIPS